MPQTGTSTRQLRETLFCDSLPLRPAPSNVPFGVTYEKIGTIQRRLAWPLHKDDTLSRSGRPTGLDIYFPRSYRRHQARLTSISVA
ncbi:hypothetical protein OH77DRAFT_1549367 [Trametes cingulata]|nr:hypothetical protein OH77DRAFT_1549367 [Trametes cingulata]